MSFPFVNCYHVVKGLLRIIFWIWGTQCPFVSFISTLPGYVFCKNASHSENQVERKRTLGCYEVRLARRIKFTVVRRKKYERGQFRSVFPHDWSSYKSPVRELFISYQQRRSLLIFHARFKGILNVSLDRPTARFFTRRVRKEIQEREARLEELDKM